MSTNEIILTKENWQNYTNLPGPSTSPHKNRQDSGRMMKQTWTCSVCRKDLSSKRSYTEHMNIHNKSRPFRCEHCSYAAASQMTLHRHKLRNHIPKAEWGYRCPYCDEAYMEPAGYQQHVQQRHPGRSATYGCPFRNCKFVSKSQRHFKDHLVKHDRNDKIDGEVDPCGLSSQQLVRYMVNDEIGHVYQQHRAAQMPMTIRPRQPIPIAPHRREPTFGEMLEKVIPSKTVIHCNQLPTRRFANMASSIDFYLNSSMPPTSSMMTSTSSTPMMTSSRSYEPLPRNYSEIPREFEIEVDGDSEFEETIHEEDNYVDAEDVVVGEEVELEGEDVGDDGDDDDVDYDDEGPPVLESFGDLVQREQKWAETKCNELIKAEVFPNGFIDDDLD